MKLSEIAFDRCVELWQRLSFCSPNNREIIKKSFQLNHTIFFKLTKKKVYEMPSWIQIHGSKSQLIGNQNKSILVETLPWKLW